MFTRYLSQMRGSHKVSHSFFICAVLMVALSMLSATLIRSEPVAAGITLPHYTSVSVPVWSPLRNQGVDMRVRTLAIVGSDLYIGGKFTRTGDNVLTGLGYIVSYDTVAGTWHALPNQGLNNEVLALAVSDNELYVAGSFTQTGDGTMLNLGNIARFDTEAGSWSALPNQGLNGEIYALAVVDGNLYAGGRFTQTSDGVLTNLGYIARYDTVAGTWHALPNQGLTGHVYVLAASGNDLYVGGAFTQSGDGTVSNLNHIARYDTMAGTWNTLPNQGLDGNVTALTVSGSDLYIGGFFSQTGDGAVPNLGNIAHFNTVAGTWNALPNQGLNDQIGVLAIFDSDLYVGGHFVQTSEGTLTDLGYIICYDTVTGSWKALPHQGLNDWVYALLPVDSHLYVGGSFYQTGDGALTGLNRIARLGFIEYGLYLPLVLK